MAEIDSGDGKETATKSSRRFVTLMALPVVAYSMAAGSVLDVE